MTDRDRLIDDIILAFDWEMGCIEKDNVWFESVQGNTPSLTDAYNRVHRTGKKYDEQRAALRRVLRRILPTDTTPPDTKTIIKAQRGTENKKKQSPSKQNQNEKGDYNHEKEHHHHP